MVIYTVYTAYIVGTRIIGDLNVTLKKYILQLQFSQVSTSASVIAAKSPVSVSLKIH